MPEFHCLICNQKTSFSYVMAVANRRKNIKHKLFTYFKCNKCGFWLLKPDLTKSELSKIYTSDYYPQLAKSVSNVLLNFLLNLSLAESYIRFLLHHVKGPKQILDIGCGTGDFALLAKNVGYNIYGLDPYEVAVKTTAEKIGKGHVFMGSISSLAVKKKKFEAITMWHVLEHLESPLQDVKVIKNSLVKGGKLLFEVPNSDSILLSLFKEKYGWHMIPEHNHYFNKQSLTRLLTSVGFKKISFSCPPKAILNFSYSFKNVLDGNLHNKLLVQVLFLISLPLSVLVVVISGFFGKGEVIRAVAEN